MLVPTMLPPSDVPELMRAVAALESDKSVEEIEPTDPCVPAPVAATNPAAALVGAVRRTVRWARGIRIGAPQPEVVLPAD